MGKWLFILIFYFIASCSRGKNLEPGKCRVLYGVSENFPVVAVVGLDQKEKEYPDLEELDGKRESIRTAVASMYPILQCFFLRFVSSIRKINYMTEITLPSSESEIVSYS